MEFETAPAARVRDTERMMGDGEVEDADGDSPLPLPARTLDISALTCTQRLTLVHVSAQFKWFLWGVLGGLVTKTAQVERRSGRVEDPACTAIRSAMLPGPTFVENDADVPVGRLPPAVGDFVAAGFRLDAPPPPPPKTPPPPPPPPPKADLPVLLDTTVFFFLTPGAPAVVPSTLLSRN